jgi:hypothetical protein
MVTVTAPARAVRVGTNRYRSRKLTPRVGLSPIVPVVYPKGHDDVLLICEALSEKPLAEIPGVLPDAASWVLNGVGELSFTGSTWDESLDHLLDPDSFVDGAGTPRMIGREIQWWRDGVLRWSGVPVHAAPTLDGKVTIGCFDLGWYILRRVMGAAQRRDRLNGFGSFDTRGLPGWVTTGSCVKAQDTSDKVRGFGSAALTGSGSIVRSFTEPTTRVGSKLPVHLSGYVKPAAGTPVGSALAAINVRGTPRGAIVSQATWTTDEDTRLGAWQPFHIYALLPPGAPHYVSVSLLSPHGTIRFDDVRSEKNDTTGAPPPGVDTAQHGKLIVHHLTDTRKGGDPRLWPVVDRETGVDEVLGERHYLHTQLTDVFGRYTNRDVGGWDWRIDERTRTIRFARRVGVDHFHLSDDGVTYFDDLVLENQLAQGGGWEVDYSEFSTDVIVLGEGDDVARPEGAYQTPDSELRAATGGVRLDWVESPPAQTALFDIDPMARELHAQKSQPQVAPSITVPLDLLGEGIPATSKDGLLRCGDRVTTTLTSGRWRMADRIRVASLTAHPATETLEVGS